MTREEVLEMIRAHLAAREVDPAVVTPDAAFGSDIDVDSVALITLVQHLEDEYGVAIEERDAVGFRTVGDAIEFVVAGVERRADRLSAGGGAT